MKKIIAALLFCTLLFLCSCYEALPTVDYNCTAAAFTEKTADYEHRVYYPVIMGIENSDAVNEAFKTAALSYMEDYLAAHPADRFYTYEIGTVSAALQHPHLVSFLCSGSFYVEETSHPVAVVYALTMDLRDGSFLDFSDIVADYPALAEKYADGKFEYVYGLSTLLDHTTFAEMIGRYDGADGNYPVTYLLAEGNHVMVVFSAALDFSLGGHAEFGIRADRVKKTLGARVCEILYPENN